MKGLLTTFTALVVLLGALPVWTETTPDSTEEPGDDLALLVSWMSGSFSSKEQAELDEEYFDIRLRMAPIWTDRTEAQWLYVEQSVAQHQERPYRQRVYRVTQIGENLFESSVYTLPDPASRIGAWRQEQPLADLTPDDLSERRGCSILMRRRGESFNGSTLGSLCESTLRGATYATSEVTITAERLMSWDRGFDADQQQVWGAEKGGYVFTKLGGLDAEQPIAPAVPAEPAPGEEALQPPGGTEESAAAGEAPQGQEESGGQQP